MKNIIVVVTLSFLAVISLTQAFPYTAQQTISEDYELIEEVISAGAKDYVYSVVAEDYKTITITLEGRNGYRPRLVIYDPEAKKIIHTEIVSVGERISYTYISDYNRQREPKETYVIAETAGGQGQTFVLEVQATAQNDAGHGTDAPASFQEAFKLEQGTYKGFLGGGDVLDNYQFELEAGRTLRLEAKPLEKGTLKLVLVDSRFSNLITRQSHEGNTIVAEYSNPRTQTFYIGMEGNVPYELTLDKGDLLITELPPEPPPLPGSEGTTTEDLVEESPVEEQEPQGDETTSEYASQEKGSIGLIIALLLILIALVGIAVYHLRGRPTNTKEEAVESAEKKKEKKSSTKKK